MRDVVVLLSRADRCPTPLPCSPRQFGRLVQGALSTPVARGVVTANRVLGNMGYRGEDLVTKTLLSPPCPADDLAQAIAATAVGAVTIERSERVTWMPGPDGNGQEVRAWGAHVDGTEQILDVAARSCRR